MNQLTVILRAISNVLKRRKKRWRIGIKKVDIFFLELKIVAYHVVAALDQLVLAHIVSKWLIVAHLLLKLLSREKSTFFSDLSRLCVDHFLSIKSVANQLISDSHIGIKAVKIIPFIIDRKISQEPIILDLLLLNIQLSLIKRTTQNLIINLILITVSFYKTLLAYIFCLIRVVLRKMMTIVWQLTFDTV